MSKEGRLIHSHMGCGSHRLPSSPCPDSAPAPPAPGAHVCPSESPGGPGVEGRGHLCTVDASLPCGTGTPRLSGCGGRKSREGSRPHFITHHACTRAHTSSCRQARSKCPKMEIFALGWWDSAWALFLKCPRMTNCLFNNNIEKNTEPPPTHTHTKPGWIRTQPYVARHAETSPGFLLGAL